MTATRAGDRHPLRDALEEHVIDEALVSLELEHGGESRGEQRVMRQFPRRRSRSNQRGWRRD
jgi:hypothetical protein